MAAVVEKIVTRYKEAMDVGDPRTADWPLMSTPWTTLGLVFVYIAFVTLGPRIMKNVKPFELKWLLVVYNFGLVVLSTYMLCEFLLSVSSIPGFNYWCQGVEPGPHPGLLRFASNTWLFFISKFVEFFDTIFFVLRKKSNQISFLHVYHHISVCLLYWAVVKWTPGGIMYFGSSVNCFVHIVMYFYYMVSALGPEYRKYLWWKKYLTSLQLFQFTSFLVYLCNAMTVKGCTFPSSLMAVLFFYVISLFILFGNFFIKEYARGNTKKKSGKSD